MIKIILGFGFWLSCTLLYGWGAARYFAIGHYKTAVFLAVMASYCYNKDWKI